MTDAKGHIRWLDSLRGIGATGVVLFHLNQPSPRPDDLYQAVSEWLWLGVPMFFVVSGFSIQSSLQRSRSTMTFLKHRFWRIYPPYIASVILVFLVVAGRKALTGTNDVTVLPLSISGMLHTLTLTTSPVSDTPGVNWVYWSLSYEAAFYILIAATSLAPKCKWPLLFAVTVAAMLTHGRADPVISGMRPLFFLNEWSSFALGAALAEWRAGRTLPAMLLAGLCILELLYNHDAAPAMTAILAAVTILASQSQIFGWLNREQVFARVGIWSYSLYLLHVPVGVFVLGWFAGALRWDGLLVHLCVDLVILAACIAAAAASFKWIELPSANFGRRSERRQLKKPTARAQEQG